MKRFLSIVGVPNIPTNLAKILQLFAEYAIEVDMIAQINQKDAKIDYAFTVHRNDYEQGLELLGLVQLEIGASSVVGNCNVAKISAVGVGMKSHAGVAGTLFQALADENIAALLISTSEIKISVLIGEKYLELGVRALHSAFFVKNTSFRVFTTFVVITH
eukprot:TRINITY_DN436_c0_g1_i7.p1 TRINITY_DN436_c0_g1~~TRINITY_DN436_c0_g1_i7.p1  ORF type:complete len:160 (-),score=27.02 TRINITY_DN436_c0_g1_i7:92-571(-)